jgi:uncharacterized membrane protein YphA (DoxX/SURF4 family)
MSTRMLAKSVIKQSGEGMKWQAFSVVLRVIVGLVFCLSGLLKLLNQDQFVEALNTYGFFSAGVIDLASLTVPHVEVLLGILYTFGIRAKMVSWVLVIGLVIFTSVGAATLIQGRLADCGCFPIAGVKEPIGIGYFIKNGTLALSCLLTGLTFRKQSDASPMAQQKSSLDSTA